MANEISQSGGPMNNNDQRFFDELAAVCKKYGASLFAEATEEVPAVLTHGRGSEGESQTTGYKSLRIGPNGEYKAVVLN